MTAAEGLPIPILEAQVSGVFVVNSSPGGVNDNLTDKQTGFAFPEKDSKALSHVLIDALKSLQENTNIVVSQINLIKIKKLRHTIEKNYDKYAQ